MKIEITAMTLASLLKDHFSYEACEEILHYYEELDETGGYQVPTLGDLCIHFAELDEEDIDDEYEVVASLSNGKALVVR